MSRYKKEIIVANNWQLTVLCLVTEVLHFYIFMPLIIMLMSFSCLKKLRRTNVFGCIL